VFKFRSTASGELPQDEDIFRTISRGVVGYMPGFEGMAPSDRWKLVYYIKSLVPDFIKYIYKKNLPVKESDVFFVNSIASLALRPIYRENELGKQLLKKVIATKKNDFTG